MFLNLKLWASSLRPSIWGSALLLFLIPIASIFYKVTVLEISFLPKPVLDHWQIQVEIRPEALVQQEVLSFPLIQGYSGQTLIDQKITRASEAQIVESPSGRLVSWPPIEIKGPVGYQSVVRLSEYEVFELKDQRETFPQWVRGFLTPIEIAEELENKIKEVERSIFFSDDSRYEKLRKLFLFITEEIRLNPNITKLDDALSLGEGASSYLRAQLLTIIARRAGIPARTVVGINLKGKVKGSSYPLVFLNEVFLNSRWNPIDLTRSKMGVQRDGILVIHRDYEEVRNAIKSSFGFFSVFAEPIKVNKYNTLTYNQDLKAKSSWMSSLSLYNLPLSLQSMFYTILLIPFGATLLAFARNIVGVNTFGIFTPVLLTLFFIETSLFMGLVFFLLVVLLGFLQRYALDRLYLLAVPRLSILLTLVIVTFTLFTLFNNEYAFFKGATLGYFPIVIITVFIERFSVYFIEEGFKNTMKTIFGTFFVAFICYLLFMFEWFKLVVFTHPELLLVAVGLNILIGDYKGYRFYEAFRFKDFAKEKA